MAGDLKTFFNNPVLSSMDPSGSDIPVSGGDPNIDLGGSSALQPAWDSAPVATPDGRETANSQSGLPLQPSRMAPGDTPPAPPTLQDRSPGIIKGS